MQLISLNLENWSSYKGKNNEYKFATTPGSEITVITAKNGFGKTSILKALNFVFFGDFESNITRGTETPKLEDFPNRPALAEGDELTTAVTLNFKHEGAEWKLRREFTAKKTAGLVILGPVQKSLTKVGSGGSLGNEAIDDFINDFVINKQVSHFYFFDGVLLEAIQSQLTSRDGNSRKLVMRSVENALGLRFLDHLNQNLRSCLTQTDLQIEAQLKALKKNEDLTAQIDKDKEQLVAVKADILAVTKLLEEQEAKRAEHDSRLLSIDPATKELATKRTQFEQDLKDLKVDEDMALENLRNIGEKAWLAPLNQKLDQMFTERELTEEKHRVIRNNRQILVQKIASLKISEAEKCCALCRQEHDAGKLKKITQEISQLESELSEMPQVDDESPSNLFKLGKAASYSKLIEGVHQALMHKNSLLIKRADLTKKIRKISDQLGDFQEDIDVKWEESQRAEADKNCKTHEQALLKLQETKVALESALESNQAKQTGNDAVSQKDQDQRLLLATLCKAIEGSFEKFRDDMRLQVQEKATEYLAVLNSEPEIYGSVEISPDYQIGIKTPEGNPLQITNAGHKQILTTAFVSAMAAVSSDKTPFVMDTALSHLDVENSNQMLEWAKYVKQQVILLVTPKELPKSVAQNILGNSIGREYEVEKASAEVSVIKEITK